MKHLVRYKTMLLFLFSGILIVLFIFVLLVKMVTTFDVEVLSIGDRISVVGEGRVVQIGTPQEVFQSSARNSFKWTITHILDKGSILYLTVDVPPELVCLVTRRSYDEMNLNKGGEVHVTFKTSAVYVF